MSTLDEIDAKRRVFGRTVSARSHSIGAVMAAMMIEPLEVWPSPPPRARTPRPADLDKKAKRKAQRRARRINRNSTR